MSITFGSIIALAWPETKVRRVGVWYDVLMKMIGVVDGEHYKVGHAALLLVNHKNGEVNYFDFGRYHTPYKQGRVRDKFTDPELNITIKATIDAGGHIANLKEILQHIAANRSTHGKGKMIASLYTGLDYDKAYQKAKNMQAKGLINYGPLDLTGTNCSRFVASVSKKGNVNALAKFLLSVPYTVSPSPMLNIRVINNQHAFYTVDTKGNFVEKKRRLLQLKKNIFPPSKYNYVDEMNLYNTLT